MYLFYVDESGSRWVRPVGNREPYNPERRFYVLLACGILDHYWYRFEEHVNSVKRSFLARINSQRGLKPPFQLELSDAEVKSTILRRRKERESLPFWSNLSEAEVELLAKTMFDALEYFKFDLCAVVIDKEHLHDYFDWEKLHRKSYELLLERVQMLMRENYSKHKAMVIVDGVGDRENLSLITKHNFFVHEGATSSGQRLSNIVQSPLFVSSDLTNGIQLADICAYNVYRAMSRNDLNYEYFRKILPYFYCSVVSPINKIDGLKIFPNESPHWKSNIIEQEKPAVGGGLK